MDVGNLHATAAAIYDPLVGEHVGSSRAGVPKSSHFRNSRTFFKYPRWPCPLRHFSALQTFSSSGFPLVLRLEKQDFRLRVWIPCPDHLIRRSSPAKHPSHWFVPASRPISRLGQRPGFESFELEFPDSFADETALNFGEPVLLKRKLQDTCDRSRGAHRDIWRIQETVEVGELIVIFGEYKRQGGSGWAAFDLKQRQKQGFELDHDINTYPPMPGVTSAALPGKLATENIQSKSSFSSILQPSVSFSALGNNSRNGTLSNNSGKNLGNQGAEGSSITPTIEKLKELHSWADDSLLADIVAAVNNDEGQASAILSTMVSSSSDKAKTDLPVPVCVYENCYDDHKIEKDGVSLEDPPSNTAHVKLFPDSLLSAPVETEWEEDDVYLSHRKDALGMMRSASRHSQAASNAFLRGDHFTAQKLSLKAREEWLAANKLNDRAAEEILHIRNGGNDIWKLDLHGLHASEAVLALEKHLQRIETQMPVNRSLSTDILAKPDVRIGQSTSFESSSHLEMEKGAMKQLALSRPRQAILQVITGSGNHSRGQAALPSAIRSFLVENGYRFEDERPGVFSVRPKFRRG
ncbi:hypothetical protein ACLOJK_014167 [Asimina triloba]